MLSWAAARTSGPTQAWCLARAPPRPVSLRQPGLPCLPSAGVTRERGSCPGETGNFSCFLGEFEKSLKTTPLPPSASPWHRRQAPGTPGEFPASLAWSFSEEKQRTRSPGLPLHTPEPFLLPDPPAGLMSPTDPACEEGEDPLGPEDLSSGGCGGLGVPASQVSPQLWFQEILEARWSLGPQQPAPGGQGSPQKPGFFHAGPEAGDRVTKWGGVSGHFRFNPRL